MRLFLYQVENKKNQIVLENVVSYTNNQVVLASGIVYEPLAVGWELSEQEDCSETLRADWQNANPSPETRLEELESLMADLLFGGDEG